MLSMETVRVDDGGKNIALIATNTGDIVALPLEFAGVMSRLKRGKTIIFHFSQRIGSHSNY